MELLTKEEKERILTERMEKMKIKNEALKKRAAEIEAEKKSLGSAAAPPSTLTDSKDWKSPEYKDDWQGRGDNEDSRRVHHSGADWPGQNPDEHRQSSWDSSQQSHGSRGSHRGQRGGRGRGFHQHQRQDPGTPAGQVQEEEDWGSEATPVQQPTSPTTPAAHSPRGGFTPSPGRGGASKGPQAGSGRLSGRVNPGQGNNRPAQDQSYAATRKQNALAYEQEMLNQGGDRRVGGGFLNDDFRQNSTNFDQRTNQEARGGSGGGRGGTRHPRNYGGGDQVDLRDKIRRDRDRKAAHGGGDFNPDLHMTGKQRHEHSRWKNEQDHYDQERIERAKSKEGNWKREWDSQKPVLTDDSPNIPAVYKEMDSKKTSADTSVMRGVATTPKGSAPANKGRGRGRGQRARKPSQDDLTEPSTRKVEQNSTDLKVTISTIDGTHQTERESQKHNMPRSPNNQNQTLKKDHHRQAAGRQRSRDEHKPHQQYNQRQHPHDKQQGYDQQVGASHRGGGRGGRRGGGGRGGAHNRQEPKHDSSKTTKDDVSSDKQVVDASLTEMSSRVESEPHTTDNKPADLNVSTSSEEQEIIVAPDEELDEDGWEDCESDEDFYEDDDTPHVSKEPTPARSDGTVSKESTPVPQGSKSSSVEPEAKQGSSSSQEASGPSKPSDTTEEMKTPVKASLHIDIRDPVNEEDDVEDVLKTPEGGRQHLDWAAEMDDESPISTPAVKTDDEC